MTVVRARSVEEAVDALTDAPTATILAGGTDLMVEFNAGGDVPDPVVSVGRIDALREWSADARVIRIGAAVTYAELMQPALARLVPALAQAARTVGSPQIRNAGTIGGNLGTASPAGDTLPVLVALDASVELTGPHGQRTMRVEDFLVGPKRTARTHAELITAIIVPVASDSQEYLKVGVRNAMVIAIASLALVLDDGGVRVAMGSVGPTPLRARAAETAYQGTMTPEEFGPLVAEASRPIDDHRASAAYRRHAIAVLAERALRRARRARPAA